jgi:hypothetical protein
MNGYNFSSVYFIRPEYLLCILITWQIRGLTFTTAWRPYSPLLSHIETKCSRSEQTTRYRQAYVLKSNCRSRGQEMLPGSINVTRVLSLDTILGQLNPIHDIKFPRAISRINIRLKPTFLRLAPFSSTGSMWGVTTVHLYLYQCVLLTRWWILVTPHIDPMMEMSPKHLFLRKHWRSWSPEKISYH